KDRVTEYKDILLAAAKAGPLGFERRKDQPVQHLDDLDHARNSVILLNPHPQITKNLATALKDSIKEFQRLETLRIDAERLVAKTEELHSKENLENQKLGAAAHVIRFLG